MDEEARRGDALPIGVVVPTRNCRSDLPSHLASMRPWLGRVREVVVVDSFSEDGTLEWMQDHLRHVRVSFLSHPPGLYPSWNAAIRHIRSPFTYISTIGDAVKPEGLEALFVAAEKLRVDVVISPPELTDRGGRAMLKTWPIHELLSGMGFREPCVLHPAVTFLCAASFIPAGILGSSASNLYRTTMLQACPFAEDMGHGGDVAWGIENSVRARFGILPETVSKFVVHSNTRDVPWGRHRRNPYPRLLESMDRAFSELVPVLEALPTTGVRKRDIQEAAEELSGLLSRRISARVMLKDYRRRGRPWILNPGAWRARARQKKCASKIREFRSVRLMKICRQMQAVSS